MAGESKIDPSKDGTDHINCWTKGRTSLGRELSNFAFRPFKHPEYGSFGSVEAFWYWLATGRQHDSLRPLSSFSAKSSGKAFPIVEMDKDEFRKQVCIAIRCKLEQHPDLMKAFLESTVPFKHYFVYGKDAIRDNAHHEWQTDYLGELRAELQAAQKPVEDKPA